MSTNKAEKTHWVRSDLERALGEDVREDIWSDLVECGIIFEWLDSPRNIKDLVRDYRELARDRRPKPTEQPISLEPDERGAALEGILGHYVDKMPLVKEFRARFLKKGLLNEKQVPGWIEGRTKVEARQIKPRGKAAFVFNNASIADPGKMPAGSQVRADG